MNTPLVAPSQALTLGQIVEVVEGKLSGLSGVLIRMGDDGRATVRLEPGLEVLLVVDSANLRPRCSGSA